MAWVGSTYGGVTPLPFDRGLSAPSSPTREQSRGATGGEGPEELRGGELPGGAGVASARRFESLGGSAGCRSGVLLAHPTR